MGARPHANWRHADATDGVDGHGMAFEPPQGAILFLEDIGERPYRIHRLLTQASQAGIFANVGGIVFGEFPNCDEPRRLPAIKESCVSSRKFHGPVLFNFPSGHTTNATWTLPFGVLAEWLAARRRRSESSKRRSSRPPIKPRLVTDHRWKSSDWEYAAPRWPHSRHYSASRARRQRL